VFGFGLMMCLLLCGAQILLPGWLRMFVEAVGQYHGYTHSQSVLEVILVSASGTSATLGHIGGEILAGIAILGWLPMLWKMAARARKRVRSLDGRWRLCWR